MHSRSFGQDSQTGVDHSSKGGTSYPYSNFKPGREPIASRPQNGAPMPQNPGEQFAAQSLGGMNPDALYQQRRMGMPGGINLPSGGQQQGQFIRPPGSMVDQNRMPPQDIGPSGGPFPHPLQQRQPQMQVNPSRIPPEMQLPNQELSKGPGSRPLGPARNFINAAMPMGGQQQMVPCMPLNPSQRGPAPMPYGMHPYGPGIPLSVQDQMRLTQQRRPLPVPAPRASSHNAAPWEELWSTHGLIGTLFPRKQRFLIEHQTSPVNYSIFNHSLRRNSDMFLFSQNNDFLLAAGMRRAPSPVLGTAVMAFENNGWFLAIAENREACHDHIQWIKRKLKSFDATATPIESKIVNILTLIETTDGKEIQLPELFVFCKHHFPDWIITFDPDLANVLTITWNPSSFASDTPDEQNPEGLTDNRTCSPSSEFAPDDFTAPFSSAPKHETRSQSFPVPRDQYQFEQLMSSLSPGNRLAANVHRATENANLASLDAVAIFTPKSITIHRCTQDSAILKVAGIVCSLGAAFAISPSAPDYKSHVRALLKPKSKL